MSFCQRDLNVGKLYPIGKKRSQTLNKMHISSALFILATASPLALAVPYIRPLVSPIPSLIPSPAELQPSGIQTPSPNPSPTPIKKCPANSRKQCCVTLQTATEQLTSNLGELIPFLSGVNIGSVLGMGCMFFSNSIKSHITVVFSVWLHIPYQVMNCSTLTSLLMKTIGLDMPDNRPDDTCRDTIACCSGAEFVSSVMNLYFRNPQKHTY